MNGLTSDQIDAKFLVFRFFFFSVHALIRERGRMKIFRNDYTLRTNVIKAYIISKSESDHAYVYIDNFYRNLNRCLIRFKSQLFCVMIYNTRENSTMHDTNGVRVGVKCDRVIDASVNHFRETRKCPESVPCKI